MTFDLTPEVLDADFVLPIGKAKVTILLTITNVDTNHNNK